MISLRPSYMQVKPGDIARDRWRDFDPILFITMLVLMGFGILAIWSAVGLPSLTGTSQSAFAPLRSLDLPRFGVHGNHDGLVQGNFPKSLPLTVVAQGGLKLTGVPPGVSQADILRAMGCHTVQGYVFAHPMFEQDYLDWTRNAAETSRSVA